MLGEVGTLASLLGLIAAFRAWKKGNEDSDFDDFLLSLDSKRHKILLEEITSNHLLSQSIRLLLKDNHDELSEKLSVIEKSISAVSFQFAGVREIAEACNVSGLSEQAISILRQLHNSDTNRFVELEKSGSTALIYSGASGAIEISEPDYLSDDLSQLHSVGLLLVDYNSQGSRVYKITREAANLVKKIDL